MSDVAAITETLGDLFYWNGSSWADIATSSLNYSWDDLVSIPAGFADGTDDEGSGGLSSYNAWPKATTFNESSSATSSPIWIQDDLYASSTLKVTATTTLYSGLSLSGGNVSSSQSIGGVLNINRGTNLGSGLVAYTNAGVGAGSLIQFFCDNTSFDGICLRIVSDGTAESPVSISGAPEGKGIVKIGAGGVGDTDASALSLDASINGFLGQGIFLKCGTGSTCVNWRTADDFQFFTASSSGQIGIGTTSPYTALGVVGEVVASHFTATTTATSTFPGIGVSSALDFFGTWADSLDDLCVAITGGSGLCDGTDDGGGGDTDDFTWATTFGSLHAATSSNLWAQGELAASSTVRFGTTGNRTLTWLSTGNLGIGTTTPTQALEINVAGTIAIPSQITVFNSGTQVGQESRLVLGGYQGRVKNVITSVLNSGGATSNLLFKYGQDAANTGLTIAGANGLLTFGSASSTQLSASSVLYVPAGAAATPGLRFPDTLSGIYAQGVSDVSFSIAGALKAFVNASGITASDTQFISSFAAQNKTNPGFTFSGESLGMFRAAANTLAFTANDTETLRMTSTLVSSSIALDFGAAPSLEIPNGTGPTADDVGEIAHDTTDNQLILDDFVVGKATNKIWSATIASTSPAFASSGLLPIPQQLDGYTITAIRCYTVSGTSKVIAIEDASGNSSEDITCDSDGAADDGSITNAAYTAAELGNIDFGATSGAVDYVSISVFGTWTRE